MLETRSFKPFFSASFYSSVTLH